MRWELGFDPTVVPSPVTGRLRTRLHERTTEASDTHAVKQPCQNDLFTFRKEVDNLVDTNQGFDTLYVYYYYVSRHRRQSRAVVEERCDFCVPIYTISSPFDHVQYVAVLRNEFGTILVDIRDGPGRPLPFESGKVTVTLHFGRRKTGLF